MLNLGDSQVAWTETKVSCSHCGLPAPLALYSQGDEDRAAPFCCYGCMTVYELLHKNGLDHFYELKDQLGNFSSPRPVVLSQSEYSYLDDPQFLEDFSEVSSDQELMMSFYLDGIHCVACLWLVEKLPQFCADVSSARLNLSTHTAVIKLTPEGKFSHAAGALASLGLTPHPLKKGQSSEAYLKKMDRKELTRIGISAAAAMNIMLYSVALYSGAPAEYIKAFNGIILFFSLPVLTYCAWPFYRSAWLNLKKRHISLDLPIAFALFYGSLRGLIEIVSVGTEYYFDTLCILIFLLSLSRYIVKKWGQRGQRMNALASFMGQHSYLVKDEGGEWQEKYSDYLMVGNLIKIRPQQVLPADGVLKTPKAHVQTAMMSGEPAPQLKEQGETLLAGYENVGDEFEYELKATKEQSLLGQIFSRIEQEQNQTSFYGRLADIVSQRLVLALIVLCSSLLIYWGFIGGNWGEAERRILSLLIITCPCALGLATPLALNRSMGLAARLGIVMKNEDLLERLNQVKRIVLDKTGTLTKGRYQLLEANYINEERRSFFNSIVCSLESQSRHPIARSLQEFLTAKIVDIENREEILGVGVKGQYGGKNYFLTSSQEQENLLGSLSLTLYEDEAPAAYFILGDEPQANAQEFVQKWQKRGFDFWLLSGDKQENVDHLAHYLGILPHQAKGEVLPDDKAQVVKGLAPAVMIGDGANDSLALREAALGIAVAGSMELSLKSCDIYLTERGLGVLDHLLELSHGTIKLIKRNLGFSLFYNIIGSSLAVAGYINPLTAAILMPISSLSVLASTLWGNDILRQLKEGNAWTS